MLWNFTALWILCRVTPQNFELMRMALAILWNTSAVVCAAHASMSLQKLHTEL